MEGSTRFRAFMGWYRIICGNGLIVRVECSDVQRRHVGNLGLVDLRERTDIQEQLEWREKIPELLETLLN